MIETIAKAGIAVGVDGIFIETHFDPANAKSDGANMLHIDYFEALMTKLVAIRKRLTRFNFTFFYIFTLKNIFLFAAFLTFFNSNTINAQEDIKIQDKYTSHNKENSLFPGENRKVIQNLMLPLEERL
jgi:hypothetical protein